MTKWQDWSDGWLKEGHYVSYMLEGVTYYERVKRRDVTHYEWPWGVQDPTGTPVTISALSASGPVVPEALELTVGYNKSTKLNRIWQMIFGIKGQIYVYIELPTDTKRHGLPKLTFPTSTFKRIAHFTEEMSPYEEPEFITEHFMMMPLTHRIDFEAWNPNSIDMTDVWLNIFINKMVTQRIGIEYYDEAGLHLTPRKKHLKYILDKLYKQAVPCRPLSILPVKSPGVA